MSKRLQVLISEAELEQLRVTARAGNVSVGEWVRQAIRRSFLEPQARSEHSKIIAVREALQVLGPTVDIEQMNREIEEGYSSGLP